MSRYFESLRSRRDPYGAVNLPDLQESTRPQRVPPPDPSNPIWQFLSPGETPYPVVPGTQERLGDPTKVITNLMDTLRERQRQQEQPTQVPPGSIPSYGGVRADLPPSLNSPPPRQAGSPSGPPLPPGWSYIEG